MSDENLVCITGVPADLSSRQVRELFRQFGTIEKLYRTTSNSGKFYSFAFLVYQHQDAVQKCIRFFLDNREYSIRVIPNKKTLASRTLPDELQARFRDMWKTYKNEIVNLHKVDKFVSDYVNSSQSDAIFDTKLRRWLEEEKQIRKNIKDRSNRNKRSESWAE